MIVPFVVGVLLCGAAVLLGRHGLTDDAGKLAPAGIALIVISLLFLTNGYDLL